MLLRSEFLGSELGSNVRQNNELSPAGSPQRNLFRYRALQHSRGRERRLALSPVGSVLGVSAARARRRVRSRCRTRCSCAGLQGGFYLSLVAWSSLNVLAVGLGTCVYLWSACTSR